MTIAADKTNATVSAGDHADHHNQLGAAANDHETRLTAAEGVAAVVREAPLNVKDPRFGALGNNTGDDLPAIHAARDLVPAQGGRILLPGRSTYRCNGQLSLDDRKNIEVVGEGNGRGTADSHGTALNFVGNPSGGHLSVRRTRSIQLKRLALLNGHATFSGYVVDGRATGDGTDDTRYLTLEDCHVNGYGTGGRGAAAGVCIANSHSFSARRTAFCDSQVGILGRVNVADYAIGATFDEMCWWQNNVVAHIKNASESWIFHSPQIEPLLNGHPGFYKHDAGFAFKGFVLDSPWMGDATVDTTDAWVQASGSGFEWRGGRCGLENGSSVGVRFDESSSAWIVQGVTVVGGQALVDLDPGPHTGACILGPNKYEAYDPPGAPGPWTATPHIGTVPSGLVHHATFGELIIGGRAMYSTGGLLELAAAMRLITDTAFYLGSGAGAGGSFLQGFEQSAEPAAAPADGGRIFFKDNGAGKTQLVVKFSSGATQVIATQP